MTVDDLMGSVIALVQGDLVVARVKAENSKGWGELSEKNSLSNCSTCVKV
jgi:hypothetical protein